MIQTGIRLGRQLLLLFGFFLVGVFIATFISGLLTPVLGVGSRNSIMTTSILQNLLAFILPAWGCMRMVDKNPLKDLGLNRGFTLKALAGIFTGWALGSVALDQIIYWNANMHLPESMSALEEKWRAMEEANTAFTDILTSDTSWWGLVSGILVVGVLTGLGEETFFRGGLQGTLIRCHVPETAAIWITAFIFSMMHFQMFGFVPRLLLGAWFGYLYWWSGSLWLPVVAHAFNNSLVVLTTWLAQSGVVDFDLETVGVVSSGFPYWALASTVLFSIFIYYCRSWFVASGNK